MKHHKNHSVETSSITVLFLAVITHSITLAHMQSPASGLQADSEALGAMARNVQESSIEQSADGLDFVRGMTGKGDSHLEAIATQLFPRKYAVDAELMPLNLINDAMLMQVSGDNTVDLLRYLRVEWQNKPVSATWSHADGEERARKAMAQWLPQRSDDSANAELNVEVVTGSERWFGVNSPSTHAWTITASWSGNEPSLRSHCWWELPLSYSNQMFCPQSAAGLHLEWDAKGARLFNDQSYAASETWPPKPDFRNPPDRYGVLDSLRSCVAPDFKVSLSADATQADPTTTGEITERIRTVNHDDSTLIRTEKWTWVGERLRSIEINQRALRIAYSGTIDEVVGAFVSPASNASDTAHEAIEPPLVAHFGRGGKLLINFRAPDPARDRVPATVTAVPDEFIFTTRGELCAWADFRSVRIGPATTADVSQDTHTAQLRATAAKHAALKSELTAAISSKESGRIQDAVKKINDFHRVLQTEPSQRAAEFEMIAFNLSQVGLANDAAAVLSSPWKDMKDAPSAIAAADRWSVALHPEFAAQIEAAASVVRSADAKEKSGAFEAELSDNRSAMDLIGSSPELRDKMLNDMPTCDSSVLSGGAKFLYEAVRGAIMSHKDRPSAKRGRDIALCNACIRESRKLARVDELHAQRVAEDAGFALQLSQYDCNQSGDPLKRVEQFANDAIKASQYVYDLEPRLSHMRAAWDQCAQAMTMTLRSVAKANSDMLSKGNQDPEALKSAIDSTLLTLSRESEHTDKEIVRNLMTQLRRKLVASRGLVGNSFRPQLDALIDIETPPEMPLRKEMLESVEIYYGVFLSANAMSELSGPSRGGTTEAVAEKLERSQQRLIGLLGALVNTHYEEWCESQLMK